jgi:two-component system sensor histidine kinase YesM
MSIRYKLFATYLLVLTISFALLLAVNVNMTTRESEAEVRYTAHKALEEAGLYLQFKEQTITEVLNFIALNDTVQSLVAADPAPYADVNVWGYDSFRLSKVLKQNYNPDIQSIQLYMKEGLAAASENADYKSMRSVESAPWYERFAASGYSAAWLPSSAIDGGPADSISVLRKVPNPQRMQQLDGIVRVVVSPQSLGSVLSLAALTPNAAAVLYNEHGDFLASSPNLKFDKSELADAVNRRLQRDERESFWDDNVRLGRERLLLGAAAIPGTDTRLALIVPYSDIWSSSNKARSRMISIFALLVPITLPFSFFVAGSATRRLRKLGQHVRKIRHGDFRIAPLPASRDEIGELTTTINQMVHSMSELMDETYTLGREVKNKELKALQAQINPHFLYNSLDLINSMAIEQDASDISDAVGELATFYKLSLSNGREMVSLRSELKHVEAYVRIQNMRYGSGISLLVDVPEPLLECSVPKIILQPLVENCILHGILEKESERGTITINAREDGGDMAIDVADDGVGMSDDQLAGVLNGSGSKMTGGFGVRNIQERIGLCFGHKYGLHYASVPGQGTCATLRLPRAPDAQGQHPERNEKVLA